MSLTLALTEHHAELIGAEDLQNLIEAYDEAFPDLELIADIVLIEPEEMQILNREQRGIDEPTDVLSFPTLRDFETVRASALKQPTLIGSIIICPVRTAEYEETLIQMMHHGLLHLLGYDHESDFSAWMAEERRILDILEHHSLIIPPVPYATV